MDRNRGRVVGLQEAMAAADGKMEVRRFVGRCPIGGCSKEGQDLGKGYEDAGAEARKRVWNHLRWSPQHEGRFDSDEAVDDFMDADDDAWLRISTQLWDMEEFDQLMANQDMADDPESAVPEPAGAPSARPKSKPKGKGKGQEQGQRGGKGKGKSLQDRLDYQIRKQTENMYHFSKAAGVCIAALRVASNMCEQAAKTFDKQREAMEEGMEEMIEAFGIDPPRRLRQQHVELSIGSSSSQIDLAKQVRRAGPY